MPNHCLGNDKKTFTMIWQQQSFQASLLLFLKIAVIYPLRIALYNCLKSICLLITSFPDNTDKRFS